MNSFLDLSDGVGRFFVHNSNSDDFATRFFETPDLMDSFSNIPRIGLRHGLNGDWGVPPNLNRPDRNLPCPSAFHEKIGCELRVTVTKPVSFRYNGYVNFLSRRT